MPATNVTITNETGGDVNIPVKGLLADTASEVLSVPVLLSNKTYQEQLAALIPSGLKVNFNGLDLDAQQMLDFAITIARLSSLAGDPMLDGMDIAVTGAMAAAGGDVKFVGRNLLQGQTFDSLQLTEGAADFTIYALKPGVSDITVELIKGAGAAGLTYNPGTGACVIDIGAAGSTDDALATLVNANGAQCEGILRANSAGGGSFTAAQSAAPLAGGAGNYAGNKVDANGGEALPANETGATSTQKWNDTDVTVTTPSGGGAATDVATAWVESNGLKSNVLSTVLV